MIVCFFVVLLLFGRVQGFAYAPNFITKTIAEQTGKEPVGLLEIETTTTTTTTTTTSDQDNNPIVVKDKIKTRFPPEPNGYLHLGHAKAVSFNFAVARMFGGDCHMRLDDTNPSKEDQEYVDSILEDVAWVQSGLFEGKPWTGPVRQTSDYFDTIHACAVSLIQRGDAYVDALTVQEMKDYRGTLTEPGKNSPHRDRPIQENLKLFEGMTQGKFAEGEYILRAKIDMASPNMNMRDPTLFRIKHEAHQATGDKWCVYPMYDFSHPIADALEGITHSLCTLEFEDHRPFYDWTIEKLAGMLPAKPQQIEFSRLNIKNTVLSKRKLIQLVEQGHVEGWDDPRMPTLSGLRRRGVPPSSLRLFCERVGISKADSNIDYSVLEDCIREDMDKTSPRAFCVLKPLKITLTNWSGGMEDIEIPRHPKLSELGERSVPFGRTLYIERTDFFDLEGPEGNNQVPKGFKRLLPNGTVRLKFAYMIRCDDVVARDEDGEPTELSCTVFLESMGGVTPDGMKRPKGIIHWVEATTAVPCRVNQYDRLFRTEEPGRDSGDYLQDTNPHSLQVLKGVFVEPSIGMEALMTLAMMRNNKEEETIYPSSLSYQFERNGYFAMDKETTMGSLVFNRVVTLRDTWGSPSEKKAGGRNRGKQQQQPLEDLRRVAMRAATVLEVSPHPEADHLWVCRVDCGDADGPRTVVVGAPVEAQSRVVAVTNLKPAKMRGIASFAMLLAASNNDGTVEMLRVPDTVPNGELIAFEGKEPSEPDAMLKSKGALKVWDRVKAGLQANDKGQATYTDKTGVHKMTTSGGPIETTSLTNAAIR